MVVGSGIPGRKVGEAPRPHLTWLPPDHRPGRRLNHFLYERSALKVATFIRLMGYTTVSEAVASGAGLALVRFRPSGLRRHCENARYRRRRHHRGNLSGSAPPFRSGH